MLKKILLSTLLFCTLLTSCVPASTPIIPIFPTIMPVASTASAVAIVDEFYTLINDAQSKNDFGKPWDLLSNESQCSPVNKCDLSYFQDRWWQSKVVYTLYDCGPNRVAAQELKYPREADPASANGSPKYWLYLLSDFEGRLMISEIDLIQAPGAECVLVK
jgi:hypothetical protein